MKEREGGNRERHKQTEREKQNTEPKHQERESMVMF
jgi:hypothetical protein